MKVSELSGHNLDIWASKAEGCRRVHPFSSKWMLAGHIIEREAIGSHKGLSSTDGQPWEAWANNEGNPDHDICYVGATMLEAAMRCYVASKFGDEVPDEIDN